MNRVIVEIPEETLLALNLPAGGAAETLRMAAAAKLFELKKLSSGAAAALAGMPRVAFLSKLADYGVDTFDLSEEQLDSETRLA